MQFLKSLASIQDFKNVFEGDVTAHNSFTDCGSTEHQVYYKSLKVREHLRCPVFSPVLNY